MKNSEREKAIERLEEVYQKSLKDGKWPPALRALVELNKLRGITPAKEQQADPQTLRQLELIAGHILPLGLTDPEFPIEEHCRIAAQKLRKVLFKNKA